MKCVIGLGNPGSKYVHTRHNVGRMVLDEIARRIGVPFREWGFSDVARASVSGTVPQIFLMVKPGTYMNASGQAVAEILEGYPVRLEDILVVHDDIDLPLGTIRFRRHGGSGGHKGIESIIGFVGTGEFSRLKIGVGRPGVGVDAAQHVLQPFLDSEVPLLGDIIDVACRGVLDALGHGLEWAMARYNFREAPQKGEDK